ncbi:hypothetical protein GCM10007079_51830 [Nocardiopsis terrae]|nr:hypothetical protein GCM10007079_51830 [Nocardiopsis terrae]
MNRKQLEWAWGAMRSLPFPEWTGRGEFHAWIVGNLLYWDSVVAGCLESFLETGEIPEGLPPEVFSRMLHELEEWDFGFDDIDYYSLSLAKCHVYLYRLVALEISGHGSGRG